MTTKLTTNILEEKGYYITQTIKKVNEVRDLIANNDALTAEDLSSAWMDATTDYNYDECEHEYRLIKMDTDKVVVQNDNAVNFLSEVEVYLARAEGATIVDTVDYYTNELRSHLRTLNFKNPSFTITQEHRFLNNFETLEVELHAFESEKSSIGSIHTHTFPVKVPKEQADLMLKIYFEKVNEALNLFNSLKYNLSFLGNIDPKALKEVNHGYLYLTPNIKVNFDTKTVELSGFGEPFHYNGEYEKLVSTCILLRLLEIDKGLINELYRSLNLPKEA